MENPEQQQTDDDKEPIQEVNEEPKEHNILYGMETCGVGIESRTTNGNGNHATSDDEENQVPILWNREELNLSDFGLDDSYTLILVDSGTFEHVCPMNFGTGLEETDIR